MSKPIEQTDLCATIQRKLRLNDDDGDEGDNSSSGSRIDNPNDSIPPPLTFVCDAGYGLPREGRPRKEKILAISRQVVNFIEWQYDHHHQQGGDGRNETTAKLILVGCPQDPDRDALEARIHTLWEQEHQHQHRDKQKISVPNMGADRASFLSQTLSFSTLSLQDLCRELCSKQNDNESATAVYLSPDAEQVLSANQSPPTILIVGLLIDRRVQVNRSLQRAEQLELTAKRLPLETVQFVLANESSSTTTSSGSNEPLNVDCILELMQQWHWNYHKEDTPPVTAFQRAAEQSLQHHAQRHPSRPVHSVQSAESKK